MPNGKTYTFTCDLEGITASKEYEVSVPNLLIEYGILETVRNYVKVTDDYALKKKTLLALLGIGEENE